PNTCADTSTVLSLNATFERGRFDESGYPSTHGGGFCHTFDASNPSPTFESFVSRCRLCPSTVTVVAARTTVVPVTDEAIVAVHPPVPPDVVQVFGLTNVPGPETIEKLIVVPSGAGTRPAPLFTFTVPVRTCVELTMFVAVGGLITMFASGAGG